VWVFHRAGVERHRAAVLATACCYAHRLDGIAHDQPALVQRRLAALPGIGPWTVAEVSRVALGDADAVSVGDYHLKHMVAWALAGRPRGTDDEMLELLEPYRGHRGRVTRLLEAGGQLAPRFGPKLSIQPIAPI
jgi:3-methyladenine DNA glycosylase/8-oxoguanine DNA glycosylase